MQSLLSFGAPLLAPFEFSFVGRLFLPELIFVLLLFPLITMRGSVFDRRVKVLLILGAAWLTGQVATDMLVGSASSDYLRGWAKIFVMLVNLCAILALTQARLNVLSAFAAGVVVGSMLTMAVRPPEYALADPWKFGYGYGITLLVVLLGGLISSRKATRLQLVPALSMTAMTAVNLALGFRSLAAICALAATAAVLAPKYHVGGAVTVKRALASTGTIVLSALALFTAYQFAAESGMLGEQAQEKYESQALGDYGVLLGGRPEILVSFAAISESPIVGHGSWARDPKYVLLLAQVRLELGYGAVGESEWDLIPTHSHLFGAWVEAGILGAPFWLWVLALAVAAIFSLGRVPPLHRPWVAFVLAHLAWDVLFSPFGAERRFITPFYIVTALAVLGPWQPTASSATALPAQRST